MPSFVAQHVCWLLQWVKQRPPQIHIYLEPQNVTLFEKKKKKGILQV